ncbi:MAG: hypothetical protein ACUVQ1_09420 [Candidatus Kapaibacteriales bacterium]
MLETEKVESAENWAILTVCDLSLVNKLFGFDLSHNRMQANLTKTLEEQKNSPS